tara:strand:+ start:1844 stop:3859 length:2016 start_codon:yes stop_codon:yes gene_type:complete
MSKKGHVAKAAGKRVAERPAEDLFGGDEGSDGDEGESLKAAFLKQYKAGNKRAVPESRTIKSQGGAQPTVTVEGIVVRTSTKDVVNRATGAKLPMLVAEVIVSKVRSNGAPDILTTGTPGFDFMLPTMKPPKDAQDGRDANDDSPDAPAGGKKDKPKAQPRKLLLPPNHKTVAIGVGGLIQASMFTMAGGADNKKKDGVDLVVPGMKVEVTGVTGGLSSDGTGLYLNTSNIVPVADGILPGHGAGEILNYLKLPDVQEGAALRMSMTMRGFFGVEVPGYLETQAQHITRRWLEARDGAVAACEAKATALRAENDEGMEAAALVMEDRAARLRATNPADLAGGAYFFTPSKNPTPDYPTFNAAILHEIAGMDFRTPKMLLDFTMGGEERKVLPEVFCVPEVTKCEFTPYNSVIIAHLRLQWIGSKSAAIASIKDAARNGGVFSLDSMGAAVGIKVDLRTDLAPVTGIIGVAKGVDMAPDLIKYGRWGIVTGINPKEATDYDVAAPFNNGFTIDVPSSIRNIGVLVTEAFIKEHLCGNSDQFAFDSDPDLQVFKIKNKNDGTESAIASPQLKLHINGYQELTSQTYKMKTAKVPPDCNNKEYRVWFKGATDAILEALGEDSGDLLNDTDDGEAAVVKAANEARLDPYTFLIQRCAVYAVAIKATTAASSSDDN